jgi:adenylate cyclase class 2
MQTEIEVKFLNIDFEVIRTKLIAVGGELVLPMRLMRRVVVDFPGRKMQSQDNAWVRVRDEGDKITLTYKTSIENKFGGATEIEVTVSDYDKTIELFKAIGMQVFTDQETKRETWMIDDVEVVLDEWPWLRPFIEIEGTSEQKVMDVAKKLGLEWKDAVFGSVTTAYRAQYPKITKDEFISSLPEIKFSTQLPAWFEIGQP